MTGIDDAVAPEPFGTAIDEATDADREWFEQHPLASERYRRIVPGELWPARYPEDTRIRVTQLRPGIRTRQPLSGPDGSYDENEAAIFAEHANVLPKTWLEKDGER